MKKGSKVLLGVLGVIVVGACVYRVMNIAPSASLTPDQQMLAIMDDGGCVKCHVSGCKLPFYSNWPIAKKIITYDVVNGCKTFDIAPMLEAIKNGQKVNEIDLAKVEKVMMDKTMPLAKYYLVHWGSQTTSAKSSVVMEWTKQTRAKYYPNPLASAEFKNETIRPLPDAVPTDSAKVALGHDLYVDTRLSIDNTVSCASCHGLETGGVDNKSHSEGVGKQLGGVNAPTVYNALFNFVQFWDGRAKTLADQAGGPPLNPVEMGNTSFDQIIAKLQQDAAFTKRFLASYPEGYSQATITNAIQEFEKTLITPNSAFDKYLKGDKNAMTADEIKGYELFKKYSCATCHAGEIMGGQSYELMGERANYFKDRKELRNDGLTDGDNGRYAQTKVERDRYRFKTPTLRNVALTAPYYHDGSLKTLEEAVTMMGKYQVGVNLTKQEVGSITTFLKALTGEYQGKKLTNTNMN
jgi:cytochrome c peroxidase